MRDIELDWKRWGLIERIAAIAIVFCSVIGPSSIYVTSLVSSH